MIALALAESLRPKALKTNEMSEEGNNNTKLLFAHQLINVCMCVCVCRESAREPNYMRRKSRAKQMIFHCISTYVFDARSTNEWKISIYRFTFAFYICISKCLHFFNTHMQCIECGMCCVYLCW